ncbi:52 kDa repressor of the inhibitor of the protein kinase, partial [Galemys pyrenaicus]
MGKGVVLEPSVAFSDFYCSLHIIGDQVHGSGFSSKMKVIASRLLENYPQAIYALPVPQTWQSNQCLLLAGFDFTVTILVLRYIFCLDTGLGENLQGQTSNFSFAASSLTAVLVPTVEHILKADLRALKCLFLVPCVIGQLKCDIFGCSEVIFEGIIHSTKLHCWNWKSTGEDLELPPILFETHCSVSERLSGLSALPLLVLIMDTCGPARMPVVGALS